MLEKTALLKAVAGTNRGVLTNPTDRLTILAAIASLEQCNPTPDPLDAKDVLEGNWRLIYTTSRGILGLEQFPLLHLGQVYQCIRPKSSQIYNIAEVYGLPLLEGLVGVMARFKPVSKSRVEVKFERSILGLQRLLNYQSPTEFIYQLESSQNLLAINIPINNSNQQGWLDTTYLDSDMRIGRGNEGSVFVLSKC